MPNSSKENRILLRILTIVGIASAACFIFYFAWLWWEARRMKFVQYPEFGITIPAGYQIHGIDVSKYQDYISWDAVKEMQVHDVKLGFAFIKATEGVNDTDPLFKRNWRKAKDAGIIRGAYHFFIAAKDGKVQAKNFTRRVELESGDLPPVLDVEQTFGTSPSQLRKGVKAWLDAVEMYYAVRPVIYTNVDFYEKYLKGFFDDYPLWVAHYLQPNRPRISRDWLFWQHSEQGRVNGILSKVDFNVFNGDSVMFRGMLVP
ncbi:MAG: glycoside hydrolase family 25 protein [Flavisolibacter sp.]